MMDASGEFLAISELCGVRCGTPTQPITKAPEKNDFPVLNRPIDCLDVMSDAFLGRLCAAYVSRSCLEILEQRTGRDGRSIGSDWMETPNRELEKSWNGGFQGKYDYRAISRESKIPEIAEEVYRNHLKNI